LFLLVSVAVRKLYCMSRGEIVKVSWVKQG
jgi:hypothetical protein